MSTYRKRENSGKQDSLVESTIPKRPKPADNSKANGRHNIHKDMERIYSLDYDTTLLAYSVLKRLGAGDVTTFEQRLRSQKVQYLGQVFGISPSYRFNLYLRGPYSPALTDDLYKLQREGIKPGVESFTPAELEEKFDKASNFITNKSTRQLELVATYHWLKNAANYPTETAVAKVKEMKKATDAEIKQTLAFTKEL